MAIPDIRLYDRLIAAKDWFNGFEWFDEEWRSLVKEERACFRESAPIVIECSSFAIALSEGDQSISRWPCYRSPWNHAFFEFLRPAHVTPKIRRFGLHLRLPPQTSKYRLHHEARQGSEEILRARCPPPTVDYVLTPYVEMTDGSLLGPGPRVGVFVCEDGCIKDKEAASALVQKSTLDAINRLQGEHAEALDIILFSSLFDLGMICSFLSCKNVTPRSQGPPPKLAKRFRERHGVDPVQYKVLEIEQPSASLKGKVIRSDAADAPQKRFHLCRGHFAEYSTERPLFGRLVGRFWIPQHTRGSLEVGVVVKDYKVKP